MEKLKDTTLERPHKVPKFHLISSCGKFCRNCAFPQNIHTRKVGEISVFYPVGDTFFKLFMIICNYVSYYMLKSF